MTDIGRDRVVDDAGRKLIEQRAVDLLHRARADLVERTKEVAASPEWTPDVAAQYAYLHAHLALERHLVDRIEQIPLIRLVDGSTCSLDALVAMATWGIVDRLDPAGGSPSIGNFPQVVIDADARADWLRSWLATEHVALVDAQSLLRPVTPAPAIDPALVEGIADVLRRAGIGLDVETGTLGDAPTRPWGAQVAEGWVLLSPARPRGRAHVWLDPRHPVLVAASDRRRPLVQSVAMVALAIAKWLVLDTARCVDAIDAWTLAQEAG
jgi:hypothetical protein